MNIIVMSLKRIKMSGFKTFVDPTVLEMPSNLVGVVGPNGCGKSNIIDAVRWVLGESSAKYLRGESMSDVIFNGSTGRKPVGQASIELVFDNNDGRFGGEFANFAEISIKRLVDRDGDNKYYLNDTRCRRRDVVAVFKGTGLGSRGYSIIQQNMIHQIIESKPDDMRQFIEEAAGISIYKQRKHETKLRIQHTETNLQRINDILHEQTKSLEKLSKQSESAKSYKELTAVKVDLQKKIALSKFSDINNKINSINSSITSLEVEHEKNKADEVKLKTDYDKNEVLKNEKLTIYEDKQKSFYEINSEINSCEEKIRSATEKKQLYANQLKNLQEELNLLDHQIQEDKNKLDILEKDNVGLVPEIETLSKQFEEKQHTLKEKRHNLSALYSEIEGNKLNHNSILNKAEVAKANIVQIERFTLSANQKISKMLEEKKNIDKFVSEFNISEVTDQLQDKKNNLSELREQITTLTQKKIELGDEYDEKQSYLNKNLYKEKSSLNATLTSISKLKDALTSNSNNNEIDKIFKQFQGVSNFIDALKVESGFEVAVESLLKSFITSKIIPESLSKNLLDAIKDKTLSLKVFIDSEDMDSALDKYSPEHIISKIDTNIAKILEPYIANVIFNDNDLSEVELQSLDSSKVYINSKGDIFTKYSYQKNNISNNSQDVAGSILLRTKEIEKLSISLDGINQEISTCEEHVKALKSSMVENDKELSSLNSQERVFNQEVISLTNKIGSLEVQYESYLSRRRVIEDEIKDINDSTEENSKRLSEYRADIENSNNDAKKIFDEIEELNKTKFAFQNEVKDMDFEVNSLRNQIQKLQIFMQENKTKLSSTNENILRSEQKVKNILQQIEQCSKNTEELDDPISQYKNFLDEKMKSQQTLEQDLTAAKQDFNDVEHTLKQIQEGIAEKNKTLNGLKGQIDNLRLELEGQKVRLEQISELISSYNIENLESELANVEVLKEPLDDLEKELVKMENKIAKLGPINMAAIDEFTTEQEREGYLRAQKNDLEEAMDTLNKAIQKIDNETKQKFKETYDKVNDNFKLLFPKLFGGGSATLILTEEDLLTTGVSVKAQPPGKKNTSIHLLSGGEKALTAVSLVFSIFQLNPAPFCLLDEVDAPLDDTNVGRFCNLVKEMADKVQFLFVTHNKIAMGMATHLIGVTMKEPGVSRLVSVNLEEAKDMVVA